MLYTLTGVASLIEQETEKRPSVSVLDRQISHPTRGLVPEVQVSGSGVRGWSEQRALSWFKLVPSSVGRLSRVAEGEVAEEVAKLNEGVVPVVVFDAAGAARVLGVDRAYFYRLLDRHELLADYELVGADGGVKRCWGALSLVRWRAGHKKGSGWSTRAGKEEVMVATAEEFAGFVVSKVDEYGAAGWGQGVKVLRAAAGRSVADHPEALCEALMPAKTYRLEVPGDGAELTVLERAAYDVLTIWALHQECLGDRAAHCVPVRGFEYKGFAYWVGFVAGLDAAGSRVREESFGLVLREGVDASELASCVSDFVRVLADYGVGFDYGRFAQDYLSLLSGGTQRDEVLSRWLQEFARGQRVGSEYHLPGFVLPISIARERREQYDTVSELVSRGEAMRFAGVAHALGLVSPVDYENFLDECQYADKDEVVCLDASMRREIMKYVDDPKQEKKLRKRRERAGDRWEYPMDFYKWDDPRSRKFR
ncbi:type I-E CRISPR-associated protein Cse2/CasB [Rothia dentocariosa]|uniref:type I-E CRISPR-associated protein Cse2/CasB n=1 Tax=Rothia dentocariosa TaxID=2047 RepID=UPI003A845F30